MSIRLISATALALLLATPAMADCKQEISSLDQAVIAAETGAATGNDMPATEHQEQALGVDQKDEEKPDSGSVTGSVEAVSPHQQQALRELPGEDRTRASTLLTEARDMAEAGDEQGCMEKVSEAKTLLGLEE